MPGTVKPKFSTMAQQVEEQKRKLVSMEPWSAEKIAEADRKLTANFKGWRKKWGAVEYKKMLLLDVQEGLKKLAKVDFVFDTLRGSFVINPKYLKPGFVSEKTSIEKLEDLSRELSYKLHGIRYNQRKTAGLKIINVDDASKLLVYKPFSDMPLQETPTYSLRQLKQAETAIAKAAKARKELGGKDVFPIDYKTGTIVRPISTFREIKFDKILEAIKVKGTIGDINADYSRMGMAFFKSIASFLEIYEPGASENQDLVIYGLKKIMKMPLNEIGKKLFFNSATIDFGGYLDSDGEKFKNINIAEFYRVFDLNLASAKNIYRRVKEYNPFTAKKVYGENWRKATKIIERLEESFVLTQAERQSYVNLVSKRAKDSVNDILQRIDDNED